MSSAQPGTPPAPPPSIPVRLGGSTTAELDDFRAPTPPSSPPRTPQDPYASSTASPSTPGTPSIPDRIVPPPLSLPAPIAGHDFRIARTAVPAPAPPKKGLQVVPLSVQKHIQRTVQRKETAAARRKHRRSFKPWTCTACKKVCSNSASKEAHQKTRQHWLNTKAQTKVCVPCDFRTTSPEDFAHHINGKRHKKRVQYRNN